MRGSSGRSREVSAKPKGLRIQWRRRRRRWNLRYGWAAQAVLALWWPARGALSAQGTSPWMDAVNELQAQFTGPIARGLSLSAFGEGGSKRTLAGITFGLGMATDAANFLAWLF